MSSFLRRHLPKCLLLAACALAPPPAVAKGPQQPPSAVFNRMLAGLETMRADENRIVIYRGAAADNSGQVLISVDDTLTLDIRKVGPGGRDNIAAKSDRDDATLASRLMSVPGMPGGVAAAMADGTDPNGRPLDGWYMPVLVDDPLDQAPANAILTRQLSSMRTGTPDHVLVDARFSLRRSLPVAYYYNSQTGFRPMVCYGAQLPFCLWSHHGRKEAELTIFSGDLVQGNTEIDARAFVPPTGRILRMALVLENRGRNPAFVGVKPTATAGVPVPAAIVQPGQAMVVAQVETATSSQRQFVIEASEPVFARVHALGFSILQPH